jgi:hypothetical protein
MKYVVPILLFSGAAFGQQYEIGANIGYGFYRGGTIFSDSGAAQAGIRNRFAAVAGLGGVGARIGAMAFTMATGFVVDRLHTYTPILVAGALLPLLGTCALLLLGGTTCPAEMPLEKSNN